jgi:isoquinoline 1-oxidoreductase beta subunit
VAQIALTRRDFGRLVVAGGIGLIFGGCQQGRGQRGLPLDWWLELHRDGRIRMLTKRVEMGQGAHTGLRTLLAEELDVEPASIDIVQVSSDPKYGEIITGGSVTLAGWHERMRRAGATARHMLLQAAARTWRVPVVELRTGNGFVEHVGSGRTEPYAALLEIAAELPAPDPKSVQLKSARLWRYIGKSAAMAHHHEIVAGRAEYGIDVRLPGMCFAVLQRAPVPGARLVDFDDTSARRVPGFIKAVALRGNAWPGSNYCRDAVAIVASNSWAAQQGREVLRANWDFSSASALDSREIFKVLNEYLGRPGVVSLARGDVSKDAERDGIELEAHYSQPYLAHAPLEPPNAVARITGTSVEVWSGTQRQTRLKEAIVRELGVKADDVVIYAELLGGSFGRRLEIDYGLEAAKLAQTVGLPVQVLWSRSDDIRYGMYRSASVHRLRGSVDSAGRMRRFEHRYAAESVLRQQEPEQITAGGADWTLAAPLVSFPYEVPNIRVEHHAVEPMVPCAWWRGTYWTNVTMAVECFIDELAELMQLDPLRFRLQHLSSNQKREWIVSDDTLIPFDPARMRGVLNAVAEAAGWNQPIPAGHARGVACGMYDSPECHAAVIAVVRLVNQAPTLIAAFIAVDVGIVVNPEVVKSQAAGGFLMGASAALREQITWQAGQVEQRGFEDYPILRMSDCPRIEVVLVPSESGICGVGEIVTPAAIAAITNAVSRLTGKRTRHWPILAGRVSSDSPTPPAQGEA